MIGAGGLFAPTIRHHNGTFYIVCTNVGAEGEDFEAENFIISTTDIWANDWSDPVQLDFRGIDPSLFVDSDGKAYLQGSWRLDRTEQPTSTIKQYEIDLRTGERLSEIREIWPGHARIYTEGPHIYRKDGYYYLLVAEGGTFEQHLLSIARAHDIWGPYESFEENPILTAYGTSEIVQDAGHGELFQGGDGLWWAAVLGVRKRGERYPMGRESFLCPVDWPTGEWPKIGHPQLKFDRETASVHSSKWWSLMSRSTRIDDCYIRTPRTEDYQFPGENFRLRASIELPSAPTGTSTFLGKRQRSDDSLASVKLLCDATEQARDLSAGLAVYKDDVRYAMMSFTPANLELHLSLRNNTSADKSIAIKKLHTIPESLSFNVTSSASTYDFWWKALPGSQWESLGQIDTAEMTCRDFTGTLFGIFAHTSDESRSEWAEFQDFSVQVASLQDCTVV